MCKHVIPVMEQRGGGSIVNIASTSGIRITGAPAVGYAAAKADVIQFERVVTVEFAPQRIRVNAILPAACVLALAASPAQAQKFPDHAIKLVIPFAPGDTDAMLRPFADKISEFLGQPVVLGLRARRGRQRRRQHGRNQQVG